MNLKLTKKPVFQSVVVFVFTTILFSCTPKPATESKLPAEPAKSDYYVAAYIWPSCHHDERFGDILWPEGTGEWEVIKKGNPRFDGHYQPRQPLWGYEMDNDPQVMERWIDAATDHGVNIFVFDWYWYDGGPFLESALNDGFLKAKNNSKMQFYIMWANHDVKHNYWNVHKYKDDTSILWNAVVDWDNYKIIVDRVIKQYFSQPNYFKIDGCPVFSVFSVDKLLESFDGDVKEAHKALDYFREEVKKAGFPGLHIQWNQGGGSVMSEESAKNFSNRVNEMGFNSVAMYNMGGLAEDYLVYGANSVKIRTQMDSILNIPLFPCVSIGWDDTPRFPAKGIHDVVHYHNTPESFAALLSKAKQYADSHPEQPRLITINAWNEWVEGSYLLPDMLNGYGYLEAVKRVVTGEFDKYADK
ncbi:MAG TPA: glycoside hydrolase family 99-like domain-containing protein [Draconibacterium sp.]|nr:glycoside hydrolase family 99-like domain-containing protein [Draconibacterium sp.]